MRIRAAVLLLILFAVPAAAQTHPFSVHDMLAMKRISNPQVSPDGTEIAFELRTTDLEANKGRFDLWTVKSDGTGLRQLTSDGANETNPRWSPDARTVYFLSTKSGSQQIWRIAREGGEAVQVSRLPLDVSNLIVSPGGSHFAFSMEVFPGTTVEETVARLAEQAKTKASGKIFDELLYRHWDAWSDGRRNHLFVMPVAGGAPVDVMKAMKADAPSRPFGGTEEFTFTPDGKGVVYTARDVGREEAWSTNLDLFFAPVDASAAPRNLTEGNDATDVEPVFSPDGKTLAYRAMARPGFEADRYRIVLRSWPDGAIRTLTEGWDRSPETIVWSGDGRTIYTAAANLGQTSLFSVDTRSGKVATLVRDGTVSLVRRAGAGKRERIIYGLDTLKMPVELFSVASNGSEVRQLTNVNRDVLAAARMGEFEQFTFKGAHDDTVYAYVVKPTDFEAGKNQNLLREADSGLRLLS